MKHLDNKIGRLFFTIGLPRSGKSTFSKQWASQIDLCGKCYTGQMFCPTGIFVEAYNNSFNVTHVNNNMKVEVHLPAIVSPDNFRLAIYGKRFDLEKECMVFPAVYAATKALLLTGHDVYLDCTTTTLYSLRRVFEMDVDAIPIIFLTPIDVCIQRAIGTKQEDLFPVITKMERQLMENYGYPDKDKMIALIENTRNDVKAGKLRGEE